MSNSLAPALSTTPTRGVPGLLTIRPPAYDYWLSSTSIKGDILKFEVHNKWLWNIYSFARPLGAKSKVGLGIAGALVRYILASCKLEARPYRVFERDSSIIPP